MHQPKPIPVAFHPHPAPVKITVGITYEAGALHANCSELQALLGIGGGKADRRTVANYAGYLLWALRQDYVGRSEEMPSWRFEGIKPWSRN
jgi:hypothetical protein